MRKIAITFPLLLLICCTSGNHEKIIASEKVIPSAKKLVVAGIVPLGFVNDSLIILVSEKMKQFYGVETRILPQIELPAAAWYKPRSRYRADTLLNFLEHYKPDSCHYIMGITGKDISCTKAPYADWGIFGYGQMPGVACVVSTFRLKRGNISQALFHERLLKVALHEFGHNLGLEHCPVKGCMMEDAEGTIVTVDNEKMELCPACTEKVCLSHGAEK